MRILLDGGMTIGAVQHTMDARVKIVGVHPNALARCILQRLVRMARQAVGLRMQKLRDPQQQEQNQRSNQQRRASIHTKRFNPLQPVLPIAVLPSNPQPWPSHATTSRTQNSAAAPRKPMLPAQCPESLRAEAEIIRPRPQPGAMVQEKG